MNAMLSSGKKERGKVVLSSRSMKRVELCAES